MLTAGEQKQLTRLLEQAAEVLEAKFRRGAEEHRREGPLEAKTMRELVEEMVGEAADQLIYSLELLRRLDSG